MSETTVHRIDRAGDPFVFRPEPGEDSPPHACARGLVYMMYMAFDEEIGDEVERLDVLPCRRCAERT